jgi:hypothetical protein
MSLRICAGPTCNADLDALGLRADAKCCSAGCRAALAKSKKDPPSHFDFFAELAPALANPSLKLIPKPDAAKWPRRGLGVTLTAA